MEVNTKLQNWCKNVGIVLDVSAPYTPQHNGKAERLNRTLMERIRALLYDSGVDKDLWGEAARTATYLINRSPTSTLKVTPAELWFGNKPDLTNLKIFGSKVYSKINTPRKKLEVRSEELMMVGYANSAYRLWNENKRKILISRDVVFLENKVVENGKRSSVENDMEFEEQIETDYGRHQRDDYMEFEESEEQNEMDIEKTQKKEEIKLPENELKEDEAENKVRTRSGRLVKTPQHLNYYEIYSAYCLLTATDEPETYKEAVKIDGWKEAIRKEIKSNETLQTWTPVQLPSSKIAIDTKWIFKTKEDGTKKARLVAKGFQVKEENSLNIMYAPVARMATIRMLLAHAVQNDWNVKQMDIPTAFLNGTIESDIYILKYLKV